MKTTEQAVFDLDLYGFTVLPAVLDQSLAAELATKLDEADANVGIDYSYDDAFARLVPCVPALDDAFMALVDHSAVIPVLEAVLGEDIVLGSMNSRIVRPGDPDQGLHSDIPAVHRRILGAPVMLQVVWAVDGFTAEKGATRIVPGSHRHPDAYPPKGIDIPHSIQPEAPAGSVIIFNGQCWHGSGANCSQKRRRAIFGHYRMGPWMRFQTDPALYVTEDHWQRMTPRQRQLFRMEHGIEQKNAADYYADQQREKRYD